MGNKPFKRDGTRSALGGKKGVRKMSKGELQSYRSTGKVPRDLAEHFRGGAAKKTSKKAVKAAAKTAARRPAAKKAAKRGRARTRAGRGGVAV